MFGFHLICFLIFFILAQVQSGSPGRFGSLTILFDPKSLIKSIIFFGLPDPRLYISFFFFTYC